MKFSIERNKTDFFFEKSKTILDRIHKSVNEKINQSNVIQRQLFHLSYNIKVKRLELGLDSPHLNRFCFC